MLNTAQKIALARAASRAVLMARTAFGRPHRGEFVRHGIRWNLDLREGIDFSIYLLGSFEPRTVAAYGALVKPNDVVLDIGANIGAHTLPLARLVGPGGRVIAFEPTAFATAKLRENVALNPDLAERIDIWQVMLTAGSSEALEPALYSSWPLATGPDLHAKHKGRLMDTSGARASTLDEIVSELGLHRVDFIKLDVDGHELAVLRGARTTLAAYRPPIAMELAPYIHTEHGHSFADLVGLLLDAGYVLRKLEDGAPLPESAAALSALVPDGAGINVLAVRR